MTGTGTATERTSVVTFSLDPETIENIEAVADGMFFGNRSMAVRHMVRTYVATKPCNSGKVEGPEG